MIYKIPFLLPFLLLFIGCTHSQKKTKSSPKDYYDKAFYYKKKKNYTSALEELKGLRKQFFYSPYNPKALLLTGDIHFEQEKYSLAVKFYEKLMKLYPHHQKDYVLYRIGLAYKKQLPSRDDQDLSLADPALKAFSALLHLKAPSAYKDKARVEKQALLDKKANRVLKSALFYRSQGWTQSAFLKIKFFLKHYPKSSLRSQALLEAFEMAELLNESPKPFKEKLIKNYPDSIETKSFRKNKPKSSFFSKWRRKIL